MIIAEYKCGYCKDTFRLTYFNSQDIPERNVGCTTCRIAGEKVVLIKKFRDERPEKVATIPKTYTLRQLREMRWQSGKGGKMYTDTFLAFLQEQEGEEEGTKVPEMKIDPGKPFVPTEGMDKKIRTHLLYPITVLESERDDIHGLPKDDQLQRAIDILNNERYKVVKEEFNIAAKKIAEEEMKKKKEK